MSNAEYNEAQFEIEKAEAVKEARNAALEEAALVARSDEEYWRKIGRNDFGNVLAGSLSRIRALKTLAILLPLLFVFGVAAGEPKSLNDAPKPEYAPRMAGIAPNYPGRPGETAESIALGQAALDEAYVYRSLKSKWMRFRVGLNAEELAKLDDDLAASKMRLDALVVAHAAVRPPKNQSK